jgi:hypothetical protein
VQKPPRLALYLCPLLINNHDDHPLLDWTGIGEDRQIRSPD